MGATDHLPVEETAGHEAALPFPRLTARQAAEPEDEQKDIPSRSLCRESGGCWQRSRVESGSWYCQSPSSGGESCWFICLQD